MVFQLIIDYWIAVNIIAFCVFGIDKRRARKKRWRIPEAVLFALALAGGALGALAGMYVFRHKTRKWYFAWGIPLILLVQTALLVYLMRVFG